MPKKKRFSISYDEMIKNKTLNEYGTPETEEEE